MPTRVVTGGVGTIPGATMFDRRRYFVDHLDQIRRLLMNEPRGHSAMSGAILQPPTRPDADYGVLYIEVSGCLPMCGNGTMGVATVLMETGMVEVTEPVTTIRLDTPAGLVVANVSVIDGVARDVTLTNVPSFALGLDKTVEVPGWGPVGDDIAFGGNFYAIVELDRLGIEFTRANRARSWMSAWRSWPPSTTRTALFTRGIRRSPAATTSTCRRREPPVRTPGMPW